MRTKKHLDTTGKVKAFAELLSNCQQVNRFDEKNEKEAWTIAHSFSDIEESSRKVLDELIPRLLEQKDPEKINSILLEIGDEFRHVMYHMKDPKFYRCLFE